ncbi:MAG: flavodoxin [Bacteroidetes bacterium]|nr:flavodoxin [Bacteroidota bacterium]MBL6962297.1 flavodoxin [Bacteroidota bacterium]
MAHIGIFYGSSHGHVENIAQELQLLFGIENADIINIRDANKQDLESYNYLIFGCSTRDKGKIQEDWEFKFNLLSEINFRGKKIALFSLGDQRHYPESFVDGMGILYDKLNENDVKIIGNWYPYGYIFKKSKAFKHGSFVGLALDEQFQHSVTKDRLQKWTDYLKSQFNISAN